MAVVNFFHAVRHNVQILCQLLQQAFQQILRLLLVLEPKVAIQVRDADTGVVLKSVAKVIHDDGCDHGLASARHARTE